MLRERDGESALVTVALGEARQGSGGLLVFSGPFGIGRSALLGQAAANAREQGVRVLRAAASSAERDVPSSVLTQFRTVPARDDASALRGEILASREPVVLVVDDMHCADRESLRWLDMLVREAPGSHALVLVSVRDGDPPTDPELVSAVLGRAAHHCALPPLPVAGVAGVVADVFDEPGDDEFVQACQQVSGGRPLLLTALLHGLRDAGRRPRKSDVDHLWSLRPSVVGERACAALGAQPPPVADTARAIALLEEADPARVASLAQLSPAEGARALQDLRTLGIVPAPDRPRFVHPVVGEAVEGALSSAQLTDWHRRAARLLQAEEQSPEAVARHLLASDTAQGEWTTGVLHAAGRRAWERGDEAVAIRCLRRALLACPTAGTERSVLLADLAAAERSSAPVAAMRHLSQALPRFDSAAQRAVALADVPPLLLGVAPQAMLGALEELREQDEVEPELAAAVDTRLRAARMCDPGWFHDTVARFGELSAQDPGPTDRAAVLLYAATLTGSDVDSVVPWARRVLTTATGPDAAFGPAPLAVRALAVADEVEEAERWLSAATGSELGAEAAQTLILDAQRAFVLARSCRHAEAVALADSTLRHCDPSLVPVVSHCVETLSLSILDAAEPGQAARVLSRYRECDQAVPVWVRELRDGALAVAAHDLGAALEHLLECGRELERMGWSNPCLLPWRSWVSLLYHRLQRPEPAGELISEEYRRAVTWGAPSGVGRALRVWGAVTDGEAGAELLRRAIDVLRGPACALELAKAHLMLGRRLLATDRAEASAHLAQGDQLATECGVPRLRSTDEIAADGGGVQAELTRAELRIARLVARGLGNQQIAAELGVSSRAVEKHLTKVYRKLGVSGRASLTDLADSLEPS